MSSTRFWDPDTTNIFNYLRWVLKCADCMHPNCTKTKNNEVPGWVRRLRPRRLSTKPRREKPRAVHTFASSDFKRVGIAERFDDARNRVWPHPGCVARPRRSAATDTKAATEGNAFPLRPLQCQFSTHRANHRGVAAKEDQVLLSVMPQEMARIPACAVATPRYGNRWCSIRMSWRRPPDPVCSSRAV